MNENPVLKLKIKKKPMKLMSFFACIALIFFMLSAYVFKPPTGKLSVKVTGLRNDKGVIYMTVFKSSDGFPMNSENAVKIASSVIENGEAEVIFTDLQPGEYAVAVLHDEDNNKEVATNWFGLPKEGVAASNNAKGSFGPPKFEDARFKLGDDGAVQIIKMEYL